MGMPWLIPLLTQTIRLARRCWLTFGMSGMGRVLAVIYAERRGKVRLISARVATKHERKIYEED